MNTQNVIQVLLSLQSIENKTIDSISKEVLSNIETVSDIQELITDLSFANSKIITPSIAALEKIYNQILQLEERNRKNNIVTITKFDAEFPASLKSLNKISAPCVPLKSLNKISAPYVSAPCVLLYCKGNITCLKQRSVAIIGTRNISPFGETVGVRLGEYVTRKGFGVVSGLALGSDTCGHRGCLNANGKTIAVLGNGLSAIYPAQNKPLAEEIIAKGGCLITEYPYDASVTPYRLIARDRLQAALANGIIIVEMGLKGGTHHTVNTAFKLRRPVACYNYSKDHYDNFPQSAGNRIEISKKTVDAIQGKGEIDQFLKKC